MFIRTGITASAGLVLVAGLMSCGDSDPVLPEAPAVAAAAAASAHAADPVLPMHATTAGTLVGMIPAPQGRCPIERPFLAIYEGTGKAIHMGRIEVSGTECLFMDPSDPSTAASGEGRFVVTAANGDELHLAYDRTVIAMEGPGSPWALWSAAVYATGGTGRFETVALVEGEWSGGLNLVTYETWSTLDGGLRWR